MTDSRSDQLEQRLDDVRTRIHEAARASGRLPTDITLVVVTKTWPSSDIRLLHALGVRHFGENRSQEAERKAAELLDLKLTWHFIGQIQSNKAAHVAAYAGVVHSVDSKRLVARLDTSAQRRGRSIDCLVQVSLDDDGVEPSSGRGGAAAEDLPELAAALDAATSLRLAGLMGVAPIDAEPVVAYRRLAALQADLRERHPGAEMLSAGMSGDYEAAIAAGATHVRVGSAILGERPLLR